MIHKISSFKIPLQHLYVPCSFHGTRACNMIYWKNMRLFAITIIWCPLLYFLNRILLTVFWENMGVYNLISCSFHAVICSNLICITKFFIIPICRIWNWINIYVSRKWLYCSELSTNFSKDNFCLNVYFNVFLPCFFFDFVRCIKISLLVTNTAECCKFLWKTHSIFLIICKINYWLMAFWT